MRILKNFSFRRPSTSVAVTVLLLVVLTISLTGLSMRVSRLNRTVNALTTSLGEEIERQNLLTQLLEGNQRTATRQLQETRQLLNLPVTEFRFSDALLATDSPAERETEITELFARAAVRILQERETRDAGRRLTETIGRNASLTETMDQLGLRVQLRRGDVLSWSLIDEAGAPWITLRISGDPSRETPRFDLETVTPQGQSHREPAVPLPELAAALQENLLTLTQERQQQQRAREALESLTRSPEVVQALAQKRLEIALENGTALIRPVGGTGALLAVDSREPLPSPRELVSTIQEIDTRPEAERRVDDARQQIEAIANDPDFTANLAEFGLRLAESPRETLDFFIYELTDLDGEAIGSFGVLKFYGEVYLLDQEAVMITSLQTLTSGAATLEPPPVTSAEQIRQMPADFPPGFRGGSAEREGTNLLLIGSHETKADAIMLVNLSPEREIRMISIPRDIYYRGRKLSDHYELYGARVFIQRVQEIIQQEIDGFVAVDMYAFIEVVDLLGGITVTLSEPLVDPTYRVRDNGVWGTLSYPAGTHTLSGIEALRIARSRATTTDFGRSERQQMLLASLRRQFNSLHAGNLEQLYQLVRILYQYVDTDLSAYDLTQYILAYRDAPIVNQAGMTFNNILYSTYSNVHNQGLSFDDLPEDFFMGLWILLPRDDNWNVIPWFVEQELRR